MRPPLRLALLALTGVVAVGLGLAVALGGSSSHTPQTTAASGETTSSAGFDGAPTPGQSPQNFTLTDQRGQRVSLGDYRGRVVILTFLSTATGRATSLLMAQQIRGALDELGSGVPVAALAVSTDPQADTPARVRDFLSRVSLTGRLEYLTGTAAELKRVWRAYAIVPGGAHAKGPDRSAYVVLIDRRGVQRVRFYVEELTPEALAHDIRKLQAD
jgi:protein SCO1